ncbi:hypothetical protein KKA95_04490, partial [Patescibacteria group bacterium]|nr:hypothetical protein [Patescibacteria group bacterium]
SSGADLRKLILERTQGQASGSQLREQLLAKTRGQVQQTAPQATGDQGQADSQQADAQGGQTDQTQPPVFAPEASTIMGMKAFEACLMEEANAEVRHHVDMLELLIFLVGDYNKFKEHSLAYNLGWDQENLNQLYRAMATRVKNDLYTEAEFGYLLNDTRPVIEIIFKELLELEYGTSGKTVREKVHELKYSLGAFKQFMSLRHPSPQTISDALADLWEDRTLTYEKLRKSKRDYLVFPETKPAQEIKFDEMVIQQTLAHYKDQGTLSAAHAAIATGTAQQPAVRSTAGLGFRPQTTGTAPQPTPAATATPAPVPQATVAPQTGIDINELTNRPELKEAIAFFDELETVFEVSTDQFNAEADYQRVFGGNSRPKIAREINAVQRPLGGRLMAMDAGGSNIYQVIAEICQITNNDELAQKVQELYAALSAKFPEFADFAKPGLSKSEEAKGLKDAFDAFMK